jgi:hypothetical protein
LSREWVLEGLKTVVRRCLQAEPLCDKRGRPTGEYTFQAAGANRALELLGKELGMFIDKSDSSVKWSGDLADLTTEQLTKLSEQMRAKAFPDGDPAAIAAAKREAEAIAELAESVQ